MLSAFINYFGLNTAQACSIAPIKTVDKNGFQEALANPNDFIITGKVVGTRLVATESDKAIKVNALGVEVITSENNKARPGDILYFYTYTISDPVCHKQVVPIDTKKYSKDSIVKVINPNFAIPSWDLTYRLILLKTME